MKIRHVLIASAALALAPAAFAQETAAPEATADCASLQAQYDQAAATASAEQLSQAKAARDEGQKLCSEGKTAEGAVWLDPNMVSPYAYWQYWRNADDGDVERFLKLFTELPLDEIARLVVLDEPNASLDYVGERVLYDGATFEALAPIAGDVPCVSYGGLSKVHLACGYRVGWAAFSGNLRGASDYLAGLELLTSLRLCSNVPAQWAVQTALGGYQSIKELLAPGGRLYESRRAILEATSSSRFLHLAPPRGSMYAFVRVKSEELPDFDDQAFALDLLEQKHVLLAPGTSFK